MEKIIEMYGKIPVFMAMMLEEKIIEYGFRNKTEVILYLVQQYMGREWMKVSKSMAQLFKRVEKKRNKLIFNAPRVTCIIKGTKQERDAMIAFARDNGFYSRTDLIIALIEAFLVSPPRVLKAISDELNERHLTELCRDNMRIATYVSELQYTILQSRAKKAGCPIGGLMREVLSLFIKVSNNEPINMSWNVTECVIDSLTTRGTTVKRFNREKVVSVFISDDEEVRQLYDMMFKYRIPGAHELARRVVLFLLNSDKMIEEDNEKDVDDSVESLFMEYEPLARNEFIYSVY